MPTWSIQDVPLRIVDTIKYLGTDFGDLNGKEHINNRVKATNRAFFALQRSGVKYPDRPVARGGSGGSADPPLRTKGPLFGTSRVKLLRPITING